MNKKNKYDLCIIGGLGHVGLPLGIVFASEGLKVCLYDINKDVGETVTSGKLPYIEYGAEKLLKKVIKEKSLCVSYKKESITDSKSVIITIGTPVDEYLNPELSKFSDFINSIKDYLVGGQHIIVRSSIYPGTTRRVEKLLNTQSTKFHISYCPERIVQGYAVEELRRLPQIVSGTSQRAVDLSYNLFKIITKNIVITSVEEAELVKLFSNSWRYIQFATANQFYMISKTLGQDYHNIRDKMMEGYERAIGLPKAGFSAGPCLLKDTMQLFSFNKGQFPLGQAAMNINEDMPNFVVKSIKNGMTLKDKKVGILGMAFKANIDDVRDSLAYKLKKLLIFEGAEVFCSDPYVNDASLVSEEILLIEAEVIIIGAPHDRYKNLNFDDYKLINIWE
jgi:UDP-N-acetyl-D-mannosaminuronic acid dehydrogenase